MKFMAILLLALFCRMEAILAFEDGVYLMKEVNEYEGIRLPLGSAGAIERKLLESEYSLDVVSTSNWNDRFSISLKHRLPSSVHVPGIALCLDGKIMSPVGTLLESIEILNKKSAVIPVSKNLADKIAKLDGGVMYLRKHLGQQLSMQFTTARTMYRKDESIDVLVQVKNVGSKENFITIEIGDDQSRSANLFIAPDEQTSASCADVKRQNQQGSFTDIYVIKPDEVVTIKQENLLHWFSLKTAGNYKFTAAYKLKIYEQRDSELPSWVEYMAGSFEFKYTD